MAVLLEPVKGGGVSMAPLRFSDQANYEHNSPDQKPAAKTSKRKAKGSA